MPVLLSRPSISVSSADSRRAAASEPRPDDSAAPSALLPAQPATQAVWPCLPPCRAELPESKPQDEITTAGQAYVDPAGQATQ